MTTPCAAVPLPGGKPSPLGETLMSHAAISSGVIGLPRSGPAAKALVVASASAASAAPSSRVDMLHLPVAVDSPARGTVVVLADERGDGPNVLALATLGHDLRARRLHVSRLVPRAALQDRRAAVPAPWNAEAGERLGEHGLLQCSFCPTPAAVGGNHHPGDAAVARISDAGDLVEPA